MPSLARADAMAEGQRVGIGGWVSNEHAETYTTGLAGQGRPEVYSRLRKPSPTLYAGMPKAKKTKRPAEAAEA